MIDGAHVWATKCLYISILFIGFICSNVAVAQQVRGTVKDVNSQAGVADAAVYFPELKRGVATNVDGSFQLDQLKTGKILLQVTHIGYENYSVRIDLSKDSTLIILLAPSLIQMKEVVVTGTQTQVLKETSFNITQMTNTQIQQSGALSLSDAISRLPGVSQLTTGVGISKPVIRGLSGNRIQVNVNGSRFDNQQWQDEHGLGLSDMGVDRVEVIKGPASLLYGSDAMGGVLNVIEEKPAPVGELQQDVGLRLYSNTLGTSLNYGIKKSEAGKWWKIRAGLDSHADYTDGNNNRVLNSRFASYNLKASVGINRKNWVNTNNVFVSYSKFGFVFDSLSRKETDARISRSFDGPHHQVLFAQASTENTFYKGLRRIKLNGGLITNLRQEDEGGGGISLSMLLNTINLTAQVSKSIGKFGEWTYGSALFFQTNTNYGGRIIVPNAVTGEASLYTHFKHIGKKLLYEGGVRYDRRIVNTFATGNLNVVGNDSPSQDVLPFNKAYNAFNVSMGGGYNLTKRLQAKLNVSTAYRPGNLAELSSNGLHEGTLRWEIGKPDALIEQNLNTEVSLNYEHPRFRASVSVYRNQFWNYIYLNPTGNEYFGFQIYQYEQSDALLKGGELAADWNPEQSKISLNASVTLIEAKKSNDENLPFIPANKFTGEIQYHFNSGKIVNPVVRAGANYVLAQNNPAQFETPTPEYILFNAGASGSLRKLNLNLTVNNLLNKTYYDHLSRFKYYGIYNMGRNIVLSINYKF
jgi:iron complex outermembrane recepter protein